MGGGPRVVVSTAAFHARARGSVPGLGGLKETKMFLPHPRVKVSIVGSLRDREDSVLGLRPPGLEFESCVWRTVSSQSSHHPQEVLLAQFSLYVHKGGLKPDSFYFFRYNIPRLSPNIHLHAYVHFQRLCIIVCIMYRNNYTNINTICTVPDWVPKSFNGNAFVTSSLFF